MTSSIPLAERVRPQSFDDVVGQEALVGPEGILTASVKHQKPFSFILWGPPGTGKTTLARIYAKATGLHFVPFSAVMSGIKEVREVMTRAMDRTLFDRGTLIFVDEIHRFNKSQQDAFLPFVESGAVVLIGATTENPSFEIVSALLSRMRVLQVQPFDTDGLKAVIRRAMNTDAILKERAIAVPDDALSYLVSRLSGDARFALNALEACFAILPNGATLERATIDKVLQRSPLLYDKNGEEHYNIISALHKSLRNSDAQASLYWLGRMLEAGEDPLYVVRRMVRFASEDVGNADPQALILAIAAKETVEFIGMPEANAALAQLAIYLAAAPKSNTAYTAMGEVTGDIRGGKVFPVPLSIRNAPTQLMKDFGYGEGYRYAHDDVDGTSDLPCLPDALRDRVYYTPKEVGFERTIKERLDYFSRAREKKRR